MVCTTRHLTHFMQVLHVYFANNKWLNVINASLNQSAQKFKYYVWCPFMSKRLSIIVGIWHSFFFFILKNFAWHIFRRGLGNYLKVGNLAKQYCGLTDLKRCFEHFVFYNTGLSSNGFIKQLIYSLMLKY